MRAHDWRRGPTVDFDGTTAYVCVRCGESGNSSYHPEVEGFDADRHYDRLLGLSPVVRLDSSSVNGLHTVEWEGECLANAKGA